METDIADEASTRAVADRVLSLYGRADILLNNAALSSGIDPRPWDAWTVDLWDRLFAINARGTWLMCKAVAPLMQEQGRGKIINLASDSARLPASEFLLPYAGSKVAIHQITQSLARALGPSGICVNSIAPGLTETEATLTLLRGRADVRRDHGPAVHQAAGEAGRPGGSRRLPGFRQLGLRHRSAADRGRGRRFRPIEEV